MSLDTLQLNSFLTLAFYKNMLVDASNPAENPESKIKNAIKFLGDNKKEYVFLVDDPGAIFLNQEDLWFFTQLIAACKLTLPDIALLNIRHTAQKTFRDITNNIPAKTLIAFGQTTSDLDLPFSIPHFQVQQYESRQYLTAPPIAKIKSDAEDKKALGRLAQNIQPFLMRTLIFATNNASKVKEVSGILYGQFNIKTLANEGIAIEIDEPFDTLEANAARKAETIRSLTGKDCFSEDTGLFVPALGGAPGVKSARYAGDEATSGENIEKLLKKLNGQTDRRGHFKTFVCLLLEGKKYLFEGICNGSIITERRGKEGFGYDSVFLPEGSSLTFAEMTSAEKNFFSHRRKAIEKLAGHLKNIDI